MYKLRLAQALVPIADELDDNDLIEEANELDEIIQELAAEAQTEQEMVKEAQGMYGYGNPGVPKFTPVKGQPTMQWNPANPVMGQPAPAWDPNKPVSSTMALQDQMQQAQQKGWPWGSWQKGPQAPGNVESVDMQWKNPEQMRKVYEQKKMLQDAVKGLDAQIAEYTGNTQNDPKWNNDPRVQALRQQKMNVMRQGAQLRTQYELPANPKGAYGDYQKSYNLVQVPQV